MPVEPPSTEDKKSVVDELHDLICRFEELLLTGLLLGLIGLGLGQIVARNAFGMALPWADDAMRAMVLWLAMIASAVAAGRLKHIRIDIVERWLSPVWLAVVRRLVLLATAMICLVMTWYSLNLVALEYEFRSMAFPGLPAWVVLLIMPIGFGLMAARFAGHAFMPVNKEQVAET